MRAKPSDDGAGLLGLRFVIVDVIGKIQLRAVFVIQRHGKIQRRQPFANEQMNPFEQRQQIFRRMRRLGNCVQRRLPRFGLLALGDIAGDGDAQLVDLRPARRPGNMRDAAVLAQVAVLEIVLRVAAHDFASGREGALAIGRVHQLDHRAADQLVRRVAENPLAGSADKNETALFVDRANGVQQQVHVARQRRRVRAFHGSTGCPHSAAISIVRDRGCASLPFHQVLFGSSPGSACINALMAKPINITPHKRVMSSS